MIKQIYTISIHRDFLHRELLKSALDRARISFVMMFDQNSHLLHQIKIKVPRTRFYLPGIECNFNGSKARIERVMKENEFKKVYNPDEKGIFRFVRD